MTGPASHYGEELQDLLEGKLTEPRRSEVAAHAARCGRCRRELEALRWVSAETRKHVVDAELPAELPSSVRAALDAADDESRRRRMWRPKWIAGGTLAAAAAVLLFVLFAGREEATFPSTVAADFRAHDAGAVRLDIESADPRVIEAYFARNGVAFPTRVFDLGMMQYHLAGGRVHQLNGRTSALFAYSGPGDTSLICQMYEGRVTELPPVDDVREHNGIAFYVHRSENLTLVFWQEGEVVCVLASDAATETVVQLAFAKAVRVEPAG
jgi:anti-sigma factor RsiW